MSTDSRATPSLPLPAGPLVEPAWVREHLEHPRLRVVDATWQPLASPKDPRADYVNAHIPGALFFDHRAVADPASEYTDTRPPAKHFASTVGDLGIGNDDFVVVYSQKGTAGGASRAWWLFRSFGHDRVAVLDGGIPRWVKEGHAVTAETVDRAPVAFSAQPRRELVVDRKALQHSVDGSDIQVLDARPPKLFGGEGVFPGGQNPRAPKPTPGRIPGSCNLPSSAVVDPDTKRLRPAAELKSLLEGSGIALDRPVVTTCSLGVGASTLALVLAAVGRSDVAVFDGAWEVWGSHPDTPKERG